jgi:hypothetical protein
MGRDEMPDIHEPNAPNHPCGFRWVETQTGVPGIPITQKEAGVGVVSRIPAVITLRAELQNSGYRLATLKVAGAETTNLAGMLAAGDVIDPAELVPWFDAKWLNPTHDDLQTLATALNVMRVTDRLKDRGKVRGDIKNTISALLRDLPQLIQHQQEDFQAAAPESPGAIKHGLAILGALNELHVAAGRADKLPGRVTPPKRTSAWFPDALWLATFVRMLGERASKSIGLTNAESPAVQLIIVAFDRALPGERVSVARAMHRHKHLIEPFCP